MRYPLPHPPARRIPRPVQRRLPTIKAMTIAVGVVATDGVVLAADTQLTITNIAWKGTGGKIMAVANPRNASVTGACAVTGATSRYEYLRGLADEIGRDFLAHVDNTDNEAAYHRAADLIHQFYARHVVPFPQD